MLYFGMIGLLLLDSSRELAEARRFRARVIAETLAENAAELAAQQMVTRQATPMFNIDTEQGLLIGTMKKPVIIEGGVQFEIYGEGVTSGITESRARVTLRGRVTGTNVKIQYSSHE